MDYGFKKLSDVEVVETPNEAAHVLIEENGVIKKAPKDEVGGIRVQSEAEVGQTLVVKAVDENGKPVEWETIDLPEGFSGSWNDLEDKPFYEEVEEITIFDGQTATIADGGASVTVGSWSELIPRDVNYRVVYDNVEYHCTSINFSYSGDTRIIGNGYLVSNSYLENNNMPFAIWYTHWGIVLYGESGTHTFSVTEFRTSVEQIEDKFIPNAWMVIRLAKDVEGNLISSKSYNEIDKAIANGVPTVLMPHKNWKQVPHFFDISGGDYYSFIHYNINNGILLAHRYRIYNDNRIEEDQPFSYTLGT